MGATGLDNTFLISQQNNVVARKILEDVKQRLFMHTETWERLKSAMKDPKIEDYDKTLKISEILRHHRELLHLILLYAPPESLSVELFNDPRFQSTRAAMEMILVIERYVTCAKLKEPSVRSVFRYIRSFLDEQPDLSGEQAAARFFQLLGQDRPLWKRLEQNFWCLAFGKKPKIEQFEYVDLSGVEKLTSRRKDKKIQSKCSSNFETIDEINEVMPSAYRLQKCAEPNNLVVKCGELCVRNDTDDSYTQLEISERQWTRKDDITLLTRFNDALKSNPAFSEEQTPSLVPELQFGAKSVVARLRYLLAELRSQSNM
uniref:Uncharacterized protein n=1 Tax=Caenorhabditis japonica TaxID=281687 RepID=A0A8R1ECY2_CAEJA